MADDGGSVPGPDSTLIASEVNRILARRGGFLSDTSSVAERALRSITRDPEVTIPALVIPVFMYVMTVGALNDVAEDIPGLNYKAFQIPVAVLFAVTGISRAMVVVTDIQTGYFDRLVISPVNRLALLLGLLIADFALVIALTVPVVIMAFIVGVGFVTGVPGILAFMFMSGLWGLIFAGFPYAIALKTGNPAAVNISFLLFFPFLFMTTLFVPREAMTGWLGAAADFNPVTHLLAALRSLISDGWEPYTLVKGLGATLGVGVVSIGMSLAALKGRATRK
ncbi:MAG: ABC transporter permease [Dehalococcoidia bacterium]|nr:ABC transporter permease [Dehalococcoidia bacterium]